jgi:hypothetical protein
LRILKILLSYTFIKTRKIPNIWTIIWVVFVCLFVKRSGRPALASVPDTINCRILISEYVHMYIISSRCRHHRGANSCNQHFSLNGDITQGGHPSNYWLSRCCCTSVLEIEGTGVSTTLSPWLWNLVCFVNQSKHGKKRKTIQSLKKLNCQQRAHNYQSPLQFVYLWKEGRAWGLLFKKTHFFRILKIISNF